MSELTAFAEHARAMSKAEHKPECSVLRTIPWLKTVRPDPDCSGCVSDDDRALWEQIADETEADLGRDDEEGLFT